MKYFVFTIRDRAVNAFMQPWFSPSDGGAIRSFTDEINRAHPDNNLNKHPEDYDLYRIGMYDDQSGTIDPQLPEMIAVGKSVLKVSG